MDPTLALKNLDRVQGLVFRPLSAQHHTRKDEFLQTTPIQMQKVNFRVAAFHLYPEGSGIL